MIGCSVSCSLSMTTMSAERAKARDIPVAGALVIAPCSQSLRNYGSVGGAVIPVGGATISAGSLLLNGTDAAAYLVTGTSADFTLVARCAWSSYGAGASNGALVNAMNANPATAEAAWKGWAAEAYTVNYYLLVNGIARPNTSIAADHDWHTVTVRRASGTTALYLDGTSRATSAAGTAGTALVLGASFNATFSSFVGGSVKNIVLFGSALSDGDRGIVEGWAA
jgi:hypothetical protein